MTVLLCIYGSFSFIFAGTYSHSDAPILKTEKLLSIDIPEHTKDVNKLPYSEGTYKFIAVMYSAERNTMQIIEYEIEYLK